MTTAALVTIVSVSYNSMAVLPAMLASVPVNAVVVVVDNASDQIEDLRNLCQSRGAKLVESPENMGFGVACNSGAALATTEFLLFLNPDATLAANTLDHLVAAARRYPKASAMNPRIIDINGRAYFKRRSDLMPRREWMARGWPAQDSEVTVLSGSALFVRRTDFAAVGGFDPAIFLYYEDDDLSRRLRSERGPILFIRAAVVQHQRGNSSARSLKTAAFKAWHMARSRVYAARKHQRPLPFLAALTSAILGLLAPDMLWSAYRRGKNAAYFTGVLSTLRDGGHTRKEP